MKKITCLVLALVLLAGFCSCSKIPEEPATTTQAVYSVVDEIASAEAESAAQTATQPQESTSESSSENTEEPATQPSTQAADSSFISSYEFIIADYYVFNKSHAKILDIELVDYGFTKIIGYAKVEMSGLAFGEDEIKIGYHAYDKDGEILKTSYLYAPVKDAKLKEGDSMDCRFEIPEGTAKVEFVEYSTVVAEIEG